MKATGIEILFQIFVAASVGFTLFLLGAHASSLEESAPRTVQCEIHYESLILDAGKWKERIVDGFCEFDLGEKTSPDCWVGEGTIQERKYGILLTYTPAYESQPNSFLVSYYTDSPRPRTQKFLYGNTTGQFELPLSSLKVGFDAQSEDSIVSCWDIVK